MLDGIPCICSLHEQSLAALLLDLVALKLLGQKQGFITRLLVAWRGLLASLWLLFVSCFVGGQKQACFFSWETGFGLTVACFAFIATMLRIHA